MKDTHSLYIFKYALGSTIAGWLPTLHAVSITPIYHVLFTVLLYLSGLLLTQLGSPQGHGPRPLAHSGYPSVPSRLLSALPLLGLISLASPRNLNPTYVSSAQILAASIFIHQSELTQGQGPRGYVLTLGLKRQHLALQ